MASTSWVAYFDDVNLGEVLKDSFNISTRRESAKQTAKRISSSRVEPLGGGGETITFRTRYHGGNWATTIAWVQGLRSSIVNGKATLKWTIDGADYTWANAVHEGRTVRQSGTEGEVQVTWTFSMPEGTQGTI